MQAPRCSTGLQTEHKLYKPSGEASTPNPATSSLGINSTPAGGSGVVPQVGRSWKQQSPGGRLWDTSLWRQPMSLFQKCTGGLKTSAAFPTPHKPTTCSTATCKTRTPTPSCPGLGGERPDPPATSAVFLPCRPSVGSATCGTRCTRTSTLDRDAQLPNTT